MVTTTLRRAETVLLRHARDAARAVLAGSTLRQSHLRRSLVRAVARDRRPLRVILGGGHGFGGPRGWYPTDVEILDITRPADWKALFGSRQIDALLSEHVWEHLPLESGLEAARLCHSFLRPGGRLRIAVPDGRHPHDAYREYVRPGDPDGGAAAHEVLFTVESLVDLLATVGFAARPLEYWDAEGRFHHEPWSAADGFVGRRPRFPTDRPCFVRGRAYAAFNAESIRPKRRITSEAWPFNYTSLIVDATKSA